MDGEIIDLKNSKKIYFASDFHLGLPNHKSSLEREKRIVRWLDTIQHDAHSIYLVGDIFDFWFEYKNVIPKGFVRLQGKLAELRDKGLPISFFTGNHDVWFFDYFQKEMGITIIRHPITLQIGKQRLFVGHGDGLDDTDKGYKRLKKIYNSWSCQWLFSQIHPDMGVRIAKYLSKKSRLRKSEAGTQREIQMILTYCNKLEKENHHDFFIFGHLHHPMQVAINSQSHYINLGDWLFHNTYACYDGNDISLLTFKS